MDDVDGIGGDIVVQTRPRFLGRNQWDTPAHALNVSRTQESWWDTTNYRQRHLFVTDSFSWNHSAASPFPREELDMEGADDIP